MFCGVPMGQWDRQDTGTNAKGGQSLGCPRNSSSGTLGQTGHWDNSQGWESLECPRDSQWDCGTDRTLGQLPRVGSPWDVSESPPVGQWDRRDTETNAKGGQSLGCPGDSQWDCGTDRTLGQLPRVGVLGMSQGLPMGLWDRQDTGINPKGGIILWSPNGTVGQWDTATNGKQVAVLGMSWELPMGQWDSGTVGQ